MLNINNTIIRRTELNVEVTLGVGAEKLAQQLSSIGQHVRGYSCTTEECENAMKYLLQLRVDQINGRPGNYNLIVYPEIFGEVIAKMQPVKTDDGITLNYQNPFSELDRQVGKEALEKVVAMCDRLRLRITSGFVDPSVVTSNVIGIEWNDDKCCHESSRQVTEEDLMMKVWVNYPRYTGWGELRYELEDPGSVFDYVKLLVTRQSANYNE